MSAQLNKILSDLARHEKLLDLDRDNLGVRAAETTAAAIFEYMDAEIGPDNSPWIALSDSYKRWKDAHYPGRKMGELEFLMKDPSQILGELQVSDHEVIQTYGLSDEARNHAEWFQEGNEPNQPPRPFYEFNDLAVVYLDSLFDSIFATIQ